MKPVGFGTLLLLALIAGQTASAETVFGAAPSAANNPWWGCAVDPPLPGAVGDDLARFYPDAAQRGNVSGMSIIQCRVARTGKPIACTWISEDPEGWGFGEASSKLGCLFKLNPYRLKDAPPAGLLVNTTVRMKPNGS
jgi:protein TonB